jgi:hypothetical protein
MIEPVNGRHVWIYHRAYEQPLAAIITYVQNPQVINVCAFLPDGKPWPMQSVTLVQDSGDSDVNAVKPYAVWMPYQKGQAQKTEELEKQIGSGG